MLRGVIIHHFFMEDQTPVVQPPASSSMQKKLIILGLVLVAIAAIHWMGQRASTMISQKAGEKLAETILQHEAGPGTDVDVNGNAVTIKSNEGAVTVGGGSLPEGWPSDVPLYAGASVQYSGKNADGSSGVIAISTDTTEKVVAYYKAEMEKNGWKSKQTMIAGGANASLYEKGDKNVSVAIMGGSGGSGTTITMGYQVKE